MKYLHDICAEHGIKPTGIVHVGASMCEEADQYRDVLGVRTVIWFEALPPDERRQERARQFGQELYEFCPLSDRRELIDLSVASNEVSSSILPFGRHSVIYPDIVVTKKIPVHSFRMDQIYYAGLPPEIDTLVLDVQGAELKVLLGMGTLLNQIKTIWAEVNLKELYVGCALKPEIDDWLAKRGFGNQEFQMIHVSEWGESLYWR